MQHVAKPCLWSPHSSRFSVARLSRQLTPVLEATRLARARGALSATRSRASRAHTCDAHTQTRTRHDRETLPLGLDRASGRLPSLTFLPAAATLPAWRFFMSAEPVMPLLLSLSAARRMAATFSRPTLSAASYLARAAALASSRACSSGVRLAAAAASTCSAALPAPPPSAARAAAFLAFSAAFFSCFRACFCAAASACARVGDESE